MKEQLIEFETARLAKEKGFDWIDKDKPYYSSDYNVLGELEREGVRLLTSWINSYKSNKKDTRYNYISLRPTQSLLQKWLRESHKIQIEIDYYRDGDCYFVKLCSFRDCSLYSSTFIDTYEEALEKGLQEALKLIKTN